MKTLLTLLFALIAFSASSQSFYSKRMKKVKHNSELNRHCETLKPKSGFFTKLNSKVLYTRKRAEYRKRRI